MNDDVNTFGHFRFVLGSNPSVDFVVVFVGGEEEEEGIRVM
jgi:hypothetical protein